MPLMPGKPLVGDVIVDPDFGREWYGKLLVGASRRQMNAYQLIAMLSAMAGDLIAENIRPTDHGEALNNVMQFAKSGLERGLSAQAQRRRANTSDALIVPTVPFKH